MLHVPDLDGSASITRAQGGLVTQMCIIASKTLQKYQRYQDHNRGHRESGFSASDRLGDINPAAYFSMPDWAQSAHENQCHEQSGIHQVGFDDFVKRYALSKFEGEVILLLFLTRLEKGYHDLVTEMQGDHNLHNPNAISADVILNILCSSFFEKTMRLKDLSKVGRLSQMGFVDSGPRSKNDAASGDVELCDAVFLYLLGEGLPYGLIESAFEHLAPVGAEDASGSILAERCHEFMASGSRDQSEILCLDKAGNGWLFAGQVATALRQLDTPCFYLSGKNLPTNTEDALAIIDVAATYATLFNALLIIDHIGNYDERLLNGIENIFRYKPVKIMWLGTSFHAERYVALPAIPHHFVTLPSEREEALAEAFWASLKNTYSQKHRLTKADCARLMDKFRPSPNGFATLLREADMVRAERGNQASLEAGDVDQVLRNRAAQRYGGMSRRIHPRSTRQDMATTRTVAEAIDDLIMAANNREAALQQGFAQKLSYGTGISALFHGPSGTGKTMAAEVVAAELGIDLVKVDLSMVMNKYIGETEKNLAQIFDRAEQDACVLFFDEADALFGKRSEVKDAKDRHANVQVAYLLQRLEAYPGIAILCTNNRSHLDNAFTRRFTFSVHFDMPDEKVRLEIWQKIWPEKIALGEDVDLQVMAEVPHISGGNIRNIALLASWYALDEGRAVSQDDLIRALRREQQKIGQLVRR